MQGPQCRSRALQTGELLESVLTVVLTARGAQMGARFIYTSMEVDPFSGLQGGVMGRALGLR